MLTLETERGKVKKMKLKSIIAVLLVLAMLVVAGCNGSQNVGDSEPDTTPEPQGQDGQLKVALLLSGPISDMGWNASAYEGLKQAEEEYGIETAYTESIAQSDIEEVFRGFAQQGFDLIIGHGFQFGDAALKVAPEFPDVKFVVTSSSITQEPNLGSTNLDNVQQGFLMGAAAAILSESGVVAGIGGQEMPPIVGSVEGFIQGAKYVNPDIEVLTAMTGSNDDVTQAKETALAMIDDGADVVMTNANQAGLGSIEACQERGVYAIGSNQDQNDIAPDTVVISGIKSSPVMITFIIEKVLAGEFEPTFYPLGVKEGAVYFSPFHGFEEKLPQEVRDQIMAIQEDMISGKIEVSEY